jgi:truncated hemoglobin YjbI
MPVFDTITEPAIAALVERFYAKARRDPVIGPVFNSAVEGLGRAPAQTVRFLVVGDADHRPLQGESHGGPHKTPDRARVFWPMALAVA